jgi:hypothetical protein
VAPDPTLPSEETERPWARASSSSSNSVVGTPPSTVSSSPSMRSSAWAAFHRRMSTTLAPTAV